MLFRSRGVRRGAAERDALAPSPEFLPAAEASAAEVSAAEVSAAEASAAEVSAAEASAAEVPAAQRPAPSAWLPGAPLSEVVLSSCGIELTWEDVVDWMREERTWEVAARRATAGAALVAEGLGGPTADELRDHAHRFRRARHLVAGEDLLRWLAHWGISEDEWVDWLDRTLRREAATAPPGVGPQVDEQATWVEAVCSGDLEDAASRVVRAMASWAARTGGAPPPGHDRFQALRAAAEELGRAEVLREDVERTLTANAAGWVQVALEWADFATVDAAREAIATMREDAMSLSAVAKLARVEVHDVLVRTEELDPRTRGVAVSAPIDSPVLVATPQDPGVVAVVRARRHPSADHPEDVALAVEVCVEQRVQAAIDRWVTRRA
jgi:hypothetical protein